MNKNRNSKVEIRGKSEIRNPKSDAAQCAAGPPNSDASQSEIGLPALGASDSLGGSYRAHEADNHALVLKEEASGARAAAPLDERTAQFGEAIIRFARKIPQNPVNNRLISQVVGAGTSIGANFCEAEDSISGKEFKLRIGTCRKESKETMLFLRLIVTAEPTLADEARTLYREAKQLNLIFGSIWRKK